MYRNLRNQARVKSCRNCPAVAVLFLFGLVFSLPTWARPTGLSPKCTLPVPDGGDVAPSPANLTGKIRRTGKDYVDVQPMNGHKLVRVVYDSDTELYTAFGGDYRPSDLARGQRV